MATRPNTDAQASESSGSAILAQYPPNISSGSPLLASTIPLPPNPLICCSVFKAVNSFAASESLTLLENARKHVVLHNEATPFIESLLPKLSITKDCAALYIFAIGSQEHICASQRSLIELSLQGLECSQRYEFSPDGIYPCSLTCSMQLIPCDACLLQDPVDEPRSTSSATVCLLPRIPLRHVVSQFIQAATDRLLEDYTRPPHPADSVARRRVAVRLRTGVLLGPQTHTAASEWSSGWEHYLRTSPLSYCKLQIHLARTMLLIHPVLASSQHSSLLSSLPIPAGSPITLLPHGVPAYYLNTYSGPSGGLAHQFEEAFIGLGVGDWKGFLKDLGSREMPQSTTPTFIIAWLPIQNKQGEAKGLPVIWPLALCVVSTLTSSTRTPLNHIPDLPAQLLASPPAHASRGPPIQLPLSSLPSSLPLSRMASPDSEPVPTSHSTLEPSLHRLVRPVISRSPASDSLVAFRSLSLEKRSTGKVALEVSNYVSAIAKERDQERERLKRERDSSGSGSFLGKPLPSPAKSAVDDGFIREALVDSLPTPAVFQQPTPATSVAGDSQRSVRPVDQPPQTNTAPSLLPPVNISSLPPEGRDTTRIVSPSVTNSSTDPPLSTHTDNIGHAAVPFDGFPGFDSTWEQSAADFMDMDIPLDNYAMGFPMDIAGNGGNDPGGFNLDDGFGAFTDDDFSFFDAPQAVVRPAADIGPAHTGGVTNGSQSTGPGVPTAGNLDNPWSRQHAAEELTPRSIGASTPGLLPSNDPHLPTSPAQTPSSHSGPATPAVVLADRPIHIRRSSVSSQGSSSFDPIPFAPTHKSADGKYALGKFALPSRTSMDSNSPSASAWKIGYAAVTDPRIGTVRRLVGIKRKRLGIHSPGREGRMSPSWVTEHEEWISSSPPGPPATELESASSSDNEEMDDDASTEERRTRSPSRVHTPPPSYLPLGPSLVATNFTHSYLLPLSRNLKPPGATEDPPIEMTMGPMSVPTPVSPAAALGVTSERNKSLESAAQIIVREIVENPVWADAWRASAVASRNEVKGPADAWQVYHGRVMEILGSVRGSRSRLDLKEILSLGAPFTQPSIKELEQPSLLVSKSDALMRILPTSLRFWEKLGLRPRAGDKDVVAFVFFESGDDNREAEVAEWLNAVSATYAAKNLGKHTPGQAVGCTRDGLVPVQLDAFRKTLVSFVASLPSTVDKAMVFYIVTPTRTVHLASPILRTMLSAVKKVKKNFPDAHILFHFVPEVTTTRNLDVTAMQHGGLEAFVEAVYERILVPAERLYSRDLGFDVKRKAFFQEPIYVLAGNTNRRPVFHLEEQSSTLDVVDRHSILHVGYHVSACRKWLTVACIDQRGEAHDQRCWMLPSTDVDDFIVENVWVFTSTFAAKASIQWRVAIAKLGFMEEAERLAWWRVLWTNAPWQVMLIVADSSHPWTFLPQHTQAHKTPKSPPRVSKPPPGTVLRDLSAATYLVHYDSPLTIPHEPYDHISPLISYIPDIEDEKPPEHCPIRPLLSSALIRAPAGSEYSPTSMLHLHLVFSNHPPHASTTIPDKTTFEEVAQNYHDLAVLAHLRWKLKANPILPFHLAAVEVMSAALTCHEPLFD